MLHIYIYVIHIYIYMYIYIYMLYINVCWLSGVFFKQKTSQNHAKRALQTWHLKEK